MDSNGLFSNNFSENHFALRIKQSALIICSSLYRNSDLIKGNLLLSILYVLLTHLTMYGDMPVAILLILFKVNYYKKFSTDYL